MNQAGIGALLLSIASLSNVLFAQSGASKQLTLETTIPMADVQGRIDHLSIDLKGQRLFVAAPGNNSLEVISWLLLHRLWPPRHKAIMRLFGLLPG